MNYFLPCAIYMGFFLAMSFVPPTFGQPGNAQTLPRSVKIYAAVLFNKSYTVGRNNPGTGLYVGDETGKTWQNLAFKNMRTFAIDIFPEYGEGLFYTANGNGVIVSRDGGKSWRVTTGWKITEVLKIRAWPRDPRIVYIGTAYGAYKSVQMGENWQQLTHRFVSALHLDAEDSRRVYLGEQQGLRYSRDGGKTFHAAKGLPYTVNAIAQNPALPKRMYAGTEDHGLYVSDDRGKSWQPLNNAFSTATIYSIRIDSKNTQRIFAATFSHGVLLSTDGGQSWQQRNHGLENIAIYDIAIHPQHPDILYAGTINHGIYRSTDGGQTWQTFALDGTQVFEIQIK